LSRIQENIDAYGWHVVIVPEDDEGPGFAYSIGLYRSLGHPEVIIFGLEVDTLHRAVNNVGAEVCQGRRFGEGDTSVEIFEGCPVAFRAVSAEHYEEYLGQAVRYYGGKEFPALQCFWPDREGRFPWQVGYSYGPEEPQPQLSA
jgi:hypothetical protein